MLMQWFPEMYLKKKLLRAGRFLSTMVVSVAVAQAPAPQTTAPKNQEEKSPKARAIGRKLEEKGVPNFGEVTPSLYRGGLLNNTGLKALARMGVKVVVDTRTDSKSERSTAETLGMQYVSIPWHCPWPHDSVFVKFFKVLQENQSKKVFVHCRLGDDRTG